MANVILIFDLGRTNKKCILFDRTYNVVEENSVTFPDIKDEDGDACEDISSITEWMKQCVEKVLKNKDYVIEAVNFSAHGASMVHLDKKGETVTPLYDYLKPVSKHVHDEFYGQFGGEKKFSFETGSPVLDMLNSGIQLFWLKNDKPTFFSQIRTSLHLPQYANFVFSGNEHADITSIGCHTGLWDFKRRQYHSWIDEQKVSHLLPKPENVNVFDKVQFAGSTIPVGIGMHDSSAALLPFVYTAKEPFILLSSGTWNVTLNPFFDDELRQSDYEKDCLYFLLDVNRRVAASRLFLGNEYQYQIRKLTEGFQKSEDYQNDVIPDKNILSKVIEDQSAETFFYPKTMKGTGPFPQINPQETNLSLFSTFEEAYHKLILDLAYLQKISLKLVCGNIKRLYITGGFIKNKLFMELLQAFLPDWQIFTAENPRASALGAALAIHHAWNQGPIPPTVCPIKLFEPTIKADISKYKFILEDEREK